MVQARPHSLLSRVHGLVGALGSDWAVKVSDSVSALLPAVHIMLSTMF